jgi:hypothetical protein
MRLTSILKFPKSFKELEHLQSLNKPKQKSYLDYIIWLQQEKDFTFKGFRKHLEQSHLDTIKEINKCVFFLR